MSAVALREINEREKRQRAEMSAYCATIPPLTAEELERLARTGQLDAEEADAYSRSAEEDRG